MKVVRESLRKTLVEDSAKRYSCTRDSDTFGRLNQVTVRLSGHVVYQMKLSYNERSQVGNSTAFQKIWAIFRSFSGPFLDPF